MATKISMKSRIGAWKESCVRSTFIPEIARRGGETFIEGDRHIHRLEVTDRAQGMAVLHAEGWRQYSRSFGAWHATLSYLVGIDDNGTWAARVPGTCTTVKEALKALTPAKVARREHLRQGDVYLVRMNGGTGTPSGVVNGTHLWDAQTRTLTHQPVRGAAHRPLRAPVEWKAVKVVPQRSFESSRGGTED